MPAEKRDNIAQIEVYHLLVRTFVENVEPTLSSSSTDVTFVCPHCSSPLVVDAAAAGLSLPCQKCGKPTVVPKVPVVDLPPPSEIDTRGNELRLQLKENESQRTEITSYINQLSIQLHRWQLRLQTLDERKRELDAKLAHPEAK